MFQRQKPAFGCIPASNTHFLFNFFIYLFDKTTNCIGFTTKTSNKDLFLFQADILKV